MDLVSRLKLYLDSRQISVTQFADECGIPRPTASQLLAGRNKKVSDEIIGKIHQCYPELNVIWLMFGEGEMVTGENIKISEPQNEDYFGFSDTQPSQAQQDSTRQNPPQNFTENQREKIESLHMEPRAAYETSPMGAPSQPAAGGEFRFSTSSPSPASDPSSTFTFSSVQHPSGNTPERPHASPLSGTPRQTEAAPRPITLTPGKGKRVTGIVVYYDDSTYESFIPDPDHSTPFLR